MRAVLEAGEQGLFVLRQFINITGQFATKLAYGLMPLPYKRCQVRWRHPIQVESCEVLTV
ncbi:hypothetical protein AS200_20465 [Streptomyces sp. CdTB01]|nr:hypothetical protein AS200_20465 [Streptomyces sp. CdTB01]